MIVLPAVKNFLQTKQQKAETHVLPIVWKLIPTVKITGTEDNITLWGDKQDADTH